MIKKVATVVHGPAVWRDKKGDVLLEDGLEVVVLLESKDGGGTALFAVRFPSTCLKIEEEIEIEVSL